MRLGRKRLEITKKKPPPPQNDYRPINGGTKKKTRVFLTVICRSVFVRGKSEPPPPFVGGAGILYNLNGIL